MKSILVVALCLAGAEPALAQPPAAAESALAAQMDAAVSAKDWVSVQGMAKKLVIQAPSQWRYSAALGDAEFNLGHYDDALAAYQVAVVGGQATLKSKPAEAPQTRAQLAGIFNNAGSSYIKLGKSAQALAAFTQAAEISPTPGQAYFNLCAIQYNAGNVEGAKTACDKAIAADPAKADAWFIKGSLLVGDSASDAQGRLKAPPGTIEALNKYLQLKPDGPHVGDVKAMLEAIGAPIVTTYGKGK